MKKTIIMRLTIIVIAVLSFTIVAKAEGTDLTDLEYKQSEEGYGYSIKEDGTVVLRSIPSDYYELERINVPEEIDGMIVTELAEYFFNYSMCDITSVFIPSTVSYLYPIIPFSIKLKEIEVDENNPYYTSIDGVLFDKEMSCLICYPLNKEGSSYTIPEGITRVGDKAFYSSRNLEQIILPESLEEIGENAFGGDITNIYIPENVEIIGDGALRCAQHFEVSENNKSFKLLDNILFSADGKELVAVPQGINENLLTYTVPDGVEIICGQTFYMFNKLEEIVLPDSVKRIGDQAFSYCPSLKKVTFGKGIDCIEAHAFEYCGLEKIELPSSVKEIQDNAFYGCPLDKIELPESLEVLGEKVFSEINTDYVEIPNNLYSIGETAFSSVNLKGFIVNKENEYFADINGVLFDKKNKAVMRFPSLSDTEEYYIPEGIKRINDYAFTNAHNLTYVSIPKSVEEIGKSAFEFDEHIRQVLLPDSIRSISDYAFHECTELESVKLYEGLEEIGEGAFYGCINIHDVYIPSTVKDLCSEAFYGCTNLYEVTLADGIKNIWGSVFEECDSLKIIDIPDSIIRIGTDAFGYCDSLERVSIGAGLEVLGNSVITKSGRLTEEGDLIFTECPSLLYYTVSDRNEHMYSVDGVLFGDDGKTLIDYPVCKAGGYYSIPEGVEKIAGHAFADCTKLYEVELPDSLRKIGEEAFYGCKNVIIQSLPEQLESIGYRAFADCFGISYVYIPESVSDIGYQAFLGGGLKRFDVDEYNSWYRTIDDVLFEIETKRLIAYPCEKEDTEYTIPDGTKAIDRVFFNSDNLRRVTIPESVEEFPSETIFDVDCFGGCDNLQTLVVVKGSPAEEWAEEQGYNVEYKEEYDWLAN